MPPCSVTKGCGEVSESPIKETSCAPRLLSKKRVFSTPIQTTNILIRIQKSLIPV